MQKKVGVDKNRITLCGDSAGGHLALVTALRLKAKTQWNPAQLILIYPMLDATASFASYTHNGQDYVITRDTLLSGYDMYRQRQTAGTLKPAHSGGMISTACRRYTLLPPSTIRYATRVKRFINI